jgi:transcriptional repressor of cell division inhibition gene dicB
MLKARAIAHFDNSPVAVARALGITRSAVNQWPELVPLKSALRLQAITDGALTVDMEVYELPTLPAHERRATA